MAKKRKIWFYGTIIALVLLLLYLHLINNSNQNLPTDDLVLVLSDGGAIRIRCLNGEVYPTQIIQTDILRCQAELDNVSEQIRNEELNISVVTGANSFGEPIPEYDYIKNSRWYKSTIRPEDYESGVAEFWIKVPPTSSFTFYVEMQGYYGAYPEKPRYWYTTTKYQDELNRALTTIQILLAIFSVPAAVLAIKSLYESG